MMMVSTSNIPPFWRYGSDVEIQLGGLKTDGLLGLQGLDELSAGERQLLWIVFLLSDKGKEFMERSSTKIAVKGFFDVWKYFVQASSKNRMMGLTSSVLYARLWNLLGILDDLTVRLIYVAIAFHQGTSFIGDITEAIGKVVPLANIGDSDGAITFSSDITLPALPLLGSLGREAPIF